MKPKFVMTPELEAIRAKGLWDHRPWMQDDNVRAPRDLLKSLPVPDDVPGMVHFLGLDGTMSTMILHHYQDLCNETEPPQSYELCTAPDDESRQFYSFPIMHKLVELYLDRDTGDEGDPDDSYGRYL